MAEDRERGREGIRDGFRHGLGLLAAFKEAIEDADSVLPVALAARSGPPVLFLLDPPAASSLGSR